MNRAVFALLCGFALGGAEPLTLRAAQEILLRTAPDIQIQRQEQEKAEAQLSEARAAFWPSLDVTGSYQALSDSNRIHFSSPPLTIDRSLGDRDREEYGLDLSYPLFTGGARIRQVQARRSAVEAQASRLRAVENQISFRLAVLFYAWHSAETAHLAQDTIAGYHRDYAARIEAVVKGGAALPSKAAAAKARLLGAELDIQAATDLRDSLGRAAALLLGLPPEPSLVFAPETGPESSDTGMAPKNPRPEIEFLDRSSEGLEYQEKALSSQRWPTVAGLLGYRVANPGLNLGTNEYMNYGLAGIQLRWNLFDGFRNRAQRAQTRAQREAIRVEKEKQTAFWEDAILSAQRLEARLEKSDQAARAAWEASRLALKEIRSQHQHGTATDLELLDAQVQEAQAALRLRQLGLQQRLAAWQSHFARGENLRFTGD